MTLLAAPWWVWVGLPLLGAWLATDENSLAQTWFSQPLPAAVLVGALLGEPAAGLLPGLLMQLVVVGNLPVGASFRLDASSATVGVTAGALLAGWRPPDAPLSPAAWTGPATGICASSKTMLTLEVPAISFKAEAIPPRVGSRKV